MAKSSMRGVIALGTIMVPVRMYKSTKDDKVSFNRVHAVDGGRIKNKMVCEVCGVTSGVYQMVPVAKDENVEGAVAIPMQDEFGETIVMCRPVPIEGTLYHEVPPGEVCKGFDVGGRMLQFTDEELDRLRPAANQNIEIETFCKLEDVPFVALGQAYYVGTEDTKKGGLARPFALLRESMKAAGKAAIIKWVSRGAAHMGVLQVDGDGFILKTLEFAATVRLNDAEVLPAEITSDTIAKGVQVIEKFTKPFDYTAIKNTYNDAVRDMIERMAAGEEIKIEEIVVAPTDNVDSALDAMLA